VNDPKETPEPADAAPDAPLNETTPPIDVQQKGAEPSDLETLDKTTPKMDSFLGSQDRHPPRRK
jgi:hypothetical protein